MNVNFYVIMCYRLELQKSPPPRELKTIRDITLHLQVKFKQLNCNIVHACTCMHTEHFIIITTIVIIISNIVIRLTFDWIVASMGMHHIIVKYCSCVVSRISGLWPMTITKLYPCESMWWLCRLSCRFSHGNSKIKRSRAQRCHRGIKWSKADNYFFFPSS